MDRDSFSISSKNLVKKCIFPKKIVQEAKARRAAAIAEAEAKARRAAAIAEAEAKARRAAAIASRASSSRRTGLEFSALPRYARPVTIRQSLMYSDCPRRSRGNGERAQPPASSPVEEDHSDLSTTISDTSKFETLSINDPVPALDSTHSDAGGDLRDTTIVAPSVTEDAPSWSERVREIKENLKKNTFDSWEALCEYWYSVGTATRPGVEAGDDEAMSEQSSPERSDERPVLASEQGRFVPAQGRYSTEQIAQNGMKWMREEVMVAFQKYFERQDDHKGCDYKFDEIRSQCFNVDNYNHIFHHFNFTVKMKGASSTDWTSVLYFAEVKEIFRRKFYFCSPLEQDENGLCYACKNQGVDDLKHPIIGAYDTGSPDTVFPYMYEDYSSDEFPYMYGDYSSDEFAPVKLDDEANEEYVF